MIFFTKIWYWIKKFWRWLLMAVFGLGIASAAIIGSTPAEIAVANCIADTTKKVSERIETCPISVNEKAAFKGLAIDKLNPVGRNISGNYEIEITDVIPMQVYLAVEQIGTSTKRTMVETNLLDGYFVREQSGNTAFTIMSGGVEVFAKARTINSENVYDEIPDGFDTQGNQKTKRVLLRTIPANTQIGMGIDGTVDIERFVIINPPILVDDPNGTIIRTWTDKVTGELKTRKLREDLREALLQSLAHTISVKIQKFGSEKIIAGKISNTTLTAYPVAGTGTAPIDGQMSRSVVNETFATIRGGAGNAVSDADNSMATGLRASATTDQYQDSWRLMVGFATSSIGSNNIDSATLSLWKEQSLTGLGDPNVDIITATPADGSDFVAGDYAIANFGSTRLATGKLLSTLGGNAAYAVWTLNASGLAAINKSGNTFFGALISWVVDNSFGGTWASIEYALWSTRQVDLAGTSTDPTLVVEHTVAAAVAAPIYPPATFYE